MDANVVSNLVSGLLSDARGERVYEPNPRADSMRMFHPEKNSEEQDLARALMFTQSKLAKLRNDEALVKRELEKTGKRCATQVLMRCDLNGVNSPTGESHKMLTTWALPHHGGSWRTAHGIKGS